MTYEQKVRWAQTVLGVSNPNDLGEVKRSYRRLAKLWHPDRNHDPNARQKFEEITVAYSLLTEPRSTYRMGSPVTEVKNDRKNRKTYSAAAYKRAAAWRKKQDAEQTRNYRLAVAYIFTITAVAFALRLGYLNYTHNRVMDNPGFTFAVVIETGPHFIRYEYTVRGVRYEHEMHVSKASYYNYSDNGMPIFEGDKYGLNFNLEKPDIHEVDFYQVHPATVEHYLKMTDEIIPSAFPELFDKMGDSEKYTASRCLALQIFELNGFDGMASLIFHSESFLENWNHNSWSFDDFKESSEFEEALQHCGFKSTSS